MQNSKRKKATQAEKTAELLKAMAADVSPQDKKDFKAEFEKSDAHVSRYLNGLGTDSSEAVAMYAFFKKRIKQRSLILNQ